jgi:hypothetical protein
MKLIRAAIVSALFVLSGSWGFLVHRTVNQLAIYQLPKKMQPFFYENRDYLVKNAIRPDQRRNQDPNEAPKHFIDLEVYGDSAAWKMPLTWNEAVAKYSRDTIIKYGYLPYWIIAMKEKLTGAFKAGNTDSILFYAADIGHYIADANVPLHTSVNYDGQLTGQRGLHALWESVIPEIELEGYQLHSHHKANYLDHPEEAVWNAVRRAHSLLGDMFAKEKEVSKQFADSTKYRHQTRNGREIKTYTPAFAKAYSAVLKPTIDEQLLHSSELIADFWYTSWSDAGKPDLTALVKTTFTKAEKKDLKKENNAYKRNQLIEKQLLIAKKDAVIDPSNQ